MKIFAAVLLASVSLGAATWPKVGPDFHPPQTNVPASFHDHSAGATTDPAVTEWWTTLNDAELTALIHRAATANLDLKVATSRVIEARAARAGSRADLLPTVSNQDAVERARGVPFVPAAPGAYESNIFQHGFDASWEIDLFGGRRRALEAATADAAAAAEARRDTLVSLLAEVARNYAELRGYQRRLDIAERNIELQQDSLDLARVRADAGLGTHLDVERQAGAARIHPRPGARA
jgi:outer membrane protein TolC